MQKTCKNKLLGCTAVLLSFTSITPALAYPLDSSVFGPDGACDSSSLNLSAGAKKGMERGSEGEYDLFGESYNYVSSGLKEGSEAGFDFGRQSRDCADARKWFSKERRRDREHERTTSLIGTGVNLLGGLIQHSQNRQAEKRAEKAQQRALEQMEAQAREIDELKALLLMQNQPYMETSGRRYPSPSTYRQYPSPAAYRVGTQSQPIYDAGVIKTSSPYRQEQGRLHPHVPGPVNQGFPSPYPHGYGQQAPMPYPYAHPQATY